MEKLLHQRIRSILFFLVLMKLSVAGRAQNIDSTLAVYADQYPHERAYLHYDKAAYAPGETIWFKAYLMEDIFPADESKTFYIDWFDDHGVLLSHTVCPLVDASTYGQFDIPAAYKGNYIHVKAYTRWMLNFDSAFLYEKDIRVIAQNPAVAPKVAIMPTLRFFPEGGDAVAGIPNRLAFMVTDQWGKPVAAKGVITDAKGKMIDSLKTLHDGMGYCFLVPQPGMVYTAKWKDEKGGAHTTALPLVKPSGISMQVTVSGTKRIFAIHATTDAATQLQTLHIIGTMQQHEVFKIVKDISSGSAAAIIPTENLPAGILTITVFDNNWNALAERITYIRNEDYFFQPQMEVDHWGLSKRARNEIRITVPDSLVADLSVAITDAAIETDSSETILSRLSLTSDLRGYVHNPAYYFSNNSDSLQQQLDLVMLTHGWRRFKWEDVVKGKLPVITYSRDTSYLSLSGQIYGALPSQLASAGTIVMILKQKDSTNKMLMAPIDRKGLFSDPSAVFFDSARVYYQLPKSSGLSDAAVKFMLDRLPPLGYRPPQNLPFANAFYNATATLRHFRLAEEAVGLEELQRVKVLENVTVTAKKKSPLEQMDEKYATGLFEGGDAYQFDIVNDPIAKGYNNIFYYLQGKVAGLQVSVNGSNVNMQWQGGTPQLYLNEMQADVDMVSSVNVSDIAYIKVFRPPFMGGFGGGNGAIAIYTRKGGDVKLPPGKGLNYNVVTGYTPVREFYSPNYDRFDPRNEQRDVRTTIYWNPRVITTLQRNQVTLTFYNNDVTESFRVIIEGMTRDGRLAHIEQMME
jgi:hypothetical protein